MLHPAGVRRIVFEVPGITKRVAHGWDVPVTYMLYYFEVCELEYEGDTCRALEPDARFDHVGA